MKNATVFCALILALSGCGLQKAVDSVGQTGEKMDQTIEQMKGTKEIIQKQPVLIALQQLEDPKNGQDLFPIPFDLMPYAKTLGQYISPDDFIELTYLWLRKINEVDFEVENPTPDQIAEFNHSKLQTYMGLMAMCGFLPDEKVQTLVATQINGFGRYEKTAVQLLMLRGLFLRNVLLQSNILSLPINNIGELQAAIGYANSLDYIARLPYAKVIGLSLSGNAFAGDVPPVPLEQTFNTNWALEMWQSIGASAAPCLEDKEVPNTCFSTGVHEKGIPSDVAASQRQALDYVNQKIKSWGAH